MKIPRAPRLDTRRAKQFAAELHERARAWIPSWGLADGERDFGRALLQIAARFSSEVAERLDDAGEKMRRGFLDWLAVRGEAARPARVPVVFKLADNARDAVLASAPVRLQVDVESTSVVLETETDVQLVPGRLELVVGADADVDAFYLPPPGLSSLGPLEPVPTRWRAKSFASAGGNQLQLDPELGLALEMIIEVGGQQYRIVQADKGIVSVDPPLTQNVTELSVVSKVAAFAPFYGPARNRQEHALYLGHKELFDIEAAATIEVVGAKQLPNVTWQYWGKLDPSQEVGWQPLALADKQRSDAVVLKKLKGAIELREILKDTGSRWIRAFGKSVDAVRPLLQTDTLQIRINRARVPSECPLLNASGEASPAAEAMANTTPIVLDNVFFPLGKEPRQFDAFYLGCTEAFSKKGAKVQLCFEMADPTFAALALVRDGAFANTVLVGVARDRALHLFEYDSATGGIGKFRDREPLQPPLPAFEDSAAVSPAPGNSVALDPCPAWRPPVWTEGADLLVAVSAGAEVWVWHENGADRDKCGWEAFGQLPASEPTFSGAMDGLVYLAGPLPVIAALRNGQLVLRVRRAGSKWEPVQMTVAGNTIVLKSIEPILDKPGGVALVQSGLVGITKDNELYHLQVVVAAGTPPTVTCTPMMSTRTFNWEVRPVAFSDGVGLMVAAVDTSVPPKLIASRGASLDETELKTGARVVGPLELVNRGELQVLASVAVGNVGYLASWVPFNPAAPLAPYEAEVPYFVGGAPTVLSRHIVIPGERGDILVAFFDLSGRITQKADIRTGVVVHESAPMLATGDVVALMTTAGKPEGRLITEGGLAPDGEVFYPINMPFSVGAISPLMAYHASAPLAGVITLPNQLQLQKGDDHEIMIGSWLLVDGDFHQVKSLDASNDSWVAIVTPDFAEGSLGAYSRPLSTGGRVAPFMRLDPTTNGAWNAALLERLSLFFPGAKPNRAHAKAFSKAGRRPIVVALSEEFNQPPVAPATFVVDAAVGLWAQLHDATPTNPELSWEYWNGKGWWKLEGTTDETLHLKSSGRVRFSVPPDIIATDWSGKTNHWIRARLIGGDYGREKVTVKTSPPDTDDVTEQTIERSSEDIRAPSVVRLRISYTVDDSVLPTYVLSQDSGSIRDQSDANRTAGAIVEAFVPLSVLLGRLSGAVMAAGEADECPPECSCPSESTGTPAMPASAATQPTSTSALASGRALYLGFNAALSGAPVNVLLLVEEERTHDQFAPMTVEALVADRFVPIVANDTTRALGESGLLSMTFALKPTPRELFGETLTWLRLTPAVADSATKWKPTVRGAYLNAVWASATETLTRELVGSSEGAPKLTLHLARPPVLHDTLELRVKEPLGEEERDELRQADSNVVLSTVKNLPGDWVLWKQVFDPADESAAARVYALDEANGEIRFGDGEHGAIPPVGRDSIVAFTYQRTEPGATGSTDAPANAITARTVLNLVSPVDSVEAVFAADQAAGGVLPEAAERVLRFGVARLRHRNRAVTANDFEDIVLQSSPDIVQARCFLRRGFVRLVVVMRGSNPVPNAAQVRELRCLLLAASPVSLSASQALRIGGPAIRHLRVDLRLRVASLDHAGAVARSVKERIAALFDTATGGTDKDGWPLGEAPSEVDIARALADTPRLEGIASVGFREIVRDGAEHPWTEAIKPTELVMLAEDAIRLTFETVEVIA